MDRQDQQRLISEKIEAEERAQKLQREITDVYKLLLAEKEDKEKIRQKLEQDHTADIAKLLNAKQKEVRILQIFSPIKNIFT